MLNLKDVLKELNCTKEQAEFVVNNQGKILNVVTDRFNNGDYFFQKWSIDDIKKIDFDNIENGSDESKPLTYEELQACRGQILKNLDDNNGIDNDTIDYAIEAIKQDRIKNLLKHVNDTYKKIGDGKNLLKNTWLIKDSILLWEDNDTEEGFYSIDVYDFENEVIKEMLFSGTLDRCIDYIEGLNNV